jgi:hypothetical protein
LLINWQELRKKLMLWRLCVSMMRFAECATAVLTCAAGVADGNAVHAMCLQPLGVRLVIPVWE